MVGVAEWLRHLVVAQKTVGSTPTAHPVSGAQCRFFVTFLDQPLLLSYNNPIS